jgi:hypothetical protein
MLLERLVGLELSFGQQVKWWHKEGEVVGLRHDGKCTTSLLTRSSISKLIITTQRGNLRGLESQKKHVAEFL